MHQAHKRTRDEYLWVEEKIQGRRADQAPWTVDGLVEGPGFAVLAERFLLPGNRGRVTSVTFAVQDSL